MKIINIILLIYNIFTFFIMGLDKFLAIKHKNRISEKLLINLSLLFGSVGTFLGMYTFRHKTKKVKFKLLIIPLIIQIIIIIYLNKTFY